MADLIRIPRGFIDDHEWRDLPTPERVRETKRDVFIRPDDPHLPELVSDARHYASEGSAGAFDDQRWSTMARAPLRALDKDGAL
jgi:hypothetical protein